MKANLANGDETMILKVQGFACFMLTQSQISQIREMNQFIWSTREGLKFFFVGTLQNPWSQPSTKYDPQKYEW